LELILGMKIQGKILSFILFFKKSKNSYFTQIRSPEGHYIRTIGPIGNLDVETEVILLEHDVPFAPFSPQVLECLPSPDWTADAHYKPRKNTEEDGFHFFFFFLYKTLVSHLI